MHIFTHVITPTICRLGNFVHPVKKLEKNFCRTFSGIMSLVQGWV